VRESVSLLAHGSIPKVKQTFIPDFQTKKEPETIRPHMGGNRTIKDDRRTA